jgi:maltose O-acetyltransferase
LNNVRDKLFLTLYTLIARDLPLSRHLKMAQILRLFFGKLIMKNVGENVNIEKGATFNKEVSIGNYSGIGVNCELNGPVTIGNYVLMGPEVVVYTRNHKFESVDKPIKFQGYGSIDPVHIGDDVWIGRRVIILPGVTIGNGCVIGAGAVIAKSIPDNAIVVGNPAKIIKYRS